MGCGVGYWKEISRRMGRMQACLKRRTLPRALEGQEACAKGAELCNAVVLRVFRRVDKCKPGSKAYNFGAR
jgi:hypothetical protein